MSNYQPVIHIVVAMGLDGAIGHKNQLLWSCRSDMQHFKRTTLDKIVVAGRKTVDSIGRALPHRDCLMLTRGDETRAGWTTVRSLEEAIQYASAQGKDLYVIGGGELYRQALPIADVIHQTIIASVYPVADVHFPPYCPSAWVHQETTGFPASLVDEYAGVIHRFHTTRYVQRLAAER